MTNSVCPRCGEPVQPSTYGDVCCTRCEWSERADRTGEVSCRLCNRNAVEEGLCMRHYDKIEMLRMERLI